MNATVLIVDDDEVSRTVLRHLLIQEGRRAIEAANGEEALAVLKENQVEIVITDIMMPVMGGIDLIHAIRNNPESRTLPVIAMTGSHGGEILKQAKSAGANEVLSKPVDGKSLLAFIQKCLP